MVERTKSNKFNLTLPSILKVPDKVRDAESVPLGHGGVGRPDALLRRAQHLRPMADMVQRLNYRGPRGNRLPSHMVPPSCAMASPPARNLGRGCLFHSQYVPSKLDDRAVQPQVDPD